MKTKNNLTKIYVLILFSMSFLNICISQDKTVDVIYLKNGKTISGTIKERIEDKTVIIETKDGTEFVEMTDVKKIEKELIPTITSFYPSYGAVGTSVTISGQNFGKKTGSSNNGVKMGITTVKIVRWSDTQITFIVPELTLAPYSISVFNGVQIDVAQTQFEVIASIQKEKVSAPKKELQSDDEKPDDWKRIGVFIIYGAYSKPMAEFGSMDSQEPKAGYGQPGFAVGFEGRIALSDYLFIPIDLQTTVNNLNFDELSKASGANISSTDKAYVGVWASIGIGLAVPLSQRIYLFGSYSYGHMEHMYPDFKIQQSIYYVEYPSSKASSEGTGYSFGITSGALTIGYKVFSTTPTYELTPQSNIGYSTNVVKIEQPTSLALFYLGITF
jgi:hypothetical protein